MTDDAGKLVLRLSVGVLMLLHGIHKLLHGVDGIGGMLAGMGLPAFSPMACSWAKWSARCW